MTRWSELRHPSAFLPLAMSLVALSMVAVHVALHGTAPQEDEGAAAHVWQLMMAGQLPVILLFVASHVTHAPREALPILALQLLALVAAVAPVLLLGW
jgi:hypothetical protein